MDSIIERVLLFLGQIKTLHYMPFCQITRFCWTIKYSSGGFGLDWHYKSKYTGLKGVNKKSGLPFKGGETAGGNQGGPTLILACRLSLAPKLKG